MVRLLLILLAAFSCVIAGCNSGDREFVDEETGESGSSGDSMDADTAKKYELTRLDAGDHRLAWVTADESIVTYHAIVPNMLKPDDKMALVLFLHPGTMNGAYMPYYGADFVRHLIRPAMEIKDALFLAPDCNFGHFANEQSLSQVMELVDKVCEIYPVDRQRTVVVGYSMGGQGVWYFARNRPDFFRAAIVLASSTPDGFGTPRMEIPVLSIHSRADEVISYNVVKSAVEALQASGSDVTFETIEDASHFQMNLYTVPLKSHMEWLRKAWEKPAK